MEEVEKAYIAGFIEGEGCIRIASNGAHSGYTLSLEVTNVDRRPLDYIAKLLDGTVSGKSRNNEPSHWRTRYRYTCNGKKALRALELLYPYLVCKRDQAKIALEFGHKYTSPAPWGRSNIEKQDQARLCAHLKALHHTIY